MDTVGAGDSLAAGYLAARLRGDAPDRQLAYAVACGTASTRAAGGTAAQADAALAAELAATIAVTAPQPGLRPRAPTRGTRSPSDLAPRPGPPRPGPAQRPA